jgi:hypothetical protein
MVVVEDAGAVGKGAGAPFSTTPQTAAVERRRPLRDSPEMTKSLQ